MGEKMGFYKKTITLTNKDNYEKGIGVLNLEKTNAGIFATLRLYDIASDNLVLGMSSGGEIIKQNILPEKNGYTFKIKDHIDINSDIGCVLCSYSDNKFYPLLWGSGLGSAKLQCDILTQFNNKNKIEKSTDFDGGFTTLHSTMQSGKKAESLATKSDFKPEQHSDKTDLEKAKLFEVDEDELEEIIDNTVNDKSSFFELISGQIDEIFNSFPEEKRFSEIIPNSRWARVDYDHSGKEYIFGLIYENDKVKYIAYGVPGEHSVPPSDVADYSQWLPIDDGGFWIMFQDAETGENISMENLTIF